LFERFERKYGDPLENRAPRVPPFKSLKVIGTDTDKSGTYDFLLTFHIATMHLRMRLVSRLQDIARYWPKIANFLNPRLSNPFDEGFRWNCKTVLGFK